MPSTIVRSLTRDYTVTSDAPELADFLAFIEARPDPDGVTRESVTIAIERTEPGYLVRLPGRDTATANLSETGDLVLSELMRGLGAEEPGAPVVHAASVRLEGRRLLLCGRKGAGKSTLTLHLLASGAAVEGDEHVVLRARDAVARPRRLRIKPGTLAFVPTLAEAVLRSPALRDSISGGPVYAFEPRLPGGEWRIEPGPVDELVFLEAAHGGSSTLGALATEEAIERLGQEAFLPAENRVGAVARLFGLARTARTWTLRVGDLPEAEARLRQSVAG